MIDPAEIAAQLRDAADAQGRSLRSVCRAAGVTHGTVIRWGGDARNEPGLPALRTLELVCVALGLRVSDVIRAAEDE